MSKLLDRVITVEYAAKDDDERRNGRSPDRIRDRSPRRGNDRAARSPSPYKRERGSPDYGAGHGRGCSPSPRRREREETQLTTVGQAGALVEEKGILSMGAALVQVLGGKGTLILNISIAQVLRERRSRVIIVLAMTRVLERRLRAQIMKERKGEKVASPDDYGHHDRIPAYSDADSLPPERQRSR